MIDAKGCSRNSYPHRIADGSAIKPHLPLQIAADVNRRLCYEWEAPFCMFFQRLFLAAKGQWKASWQKHRPKESSRRIASPHQVL